MGSQLREFIESLNSTNVEYLIVGGYAVAFHGHPRFTADIDFFIAVNPQNAQAVVNAIDQFGFGSLGLTPADFLQPDAIIQIGHPPNRIDLITEISAVSFSDAWPTRVPGTLDGVPVNFISRELLLKNKRATGRPKDIADVDQLQ